MGLKPSRDYSYGGLHDDLKEFPEDAVADPADHVFDEPPSDGVPWRVEPSRAHAGRARGRAGSGGGAPGRRTA